MSKADLLVAPCDYKAAKFAVMRWHYSRAMPSTMTRPVYFGAWEAGRFIGVVVFSHGSNRNIGKPYGLSITECVELVRVALGPHISPTSQVVSRAVCQFRKRNRGIRLVVSYADMSQGHAGTLYQALNWVYVGVSGGGTEFRIAGKRVHKKAAWASYGTNRAARIGGDRIEASRKHKYLYPLDRAMRRQIEPLSQPYPKKHANEAT